MWLYAQYVPDCGKDAQHNVAHTLFKQAVETHYQIPLSPLERGEHGKPFIPTHPEIAFNLSHCDGLAVCLIGHARAVGVDAELIRPRRQGVLRRAFSTEEAELVESSIDPDELFFCYWTLKESYVKAIGVGISYPLREVCFRIRDDRIWSSVSGFQFAQFRLDGRWIVSCCVPEDASMPEQVLFMQ